jgi:hypothetical protein
MQDQVGFGRSNVKIQDHRLGIRRKELLRSGLGRLVGLFSTSIIVDQRDERKGDITVNRQDMNAV